MINKIVKILKSNRGESIMESVVALVILGMLMTTIMAIIAFSLTMTARSTSNATVTQAAFNELFLGNGFDEDNSVLLTITTVDFEVSHNVVIGTVEVVAGVPFGFAFLPDPD
ncbi:MAG: hypothetical protein LBC73_09870 [Oscillospiraceae bacterium]|jgi:Tfp pilus assembly protein PilV|nr:hypothetical protein [Oscillospiraceae bacterium]